MTAPERPLIVVVVAGYTRFSTRWLFRLYDRHRISHGQLFRSRIPSIMSRYKRVPRCINMLPPRFRFPLVPSLSLSVFRTYRRREFGKRTRLRIFLSVSCEHSPKLVRHVNAQPFNSYKLLIHHRSSNQIKKPINIIHSNAHVYALYWLSLVKWSTWSTGQTQNYLTFFCWLITRLHN